MANLGALGPPAVSYIAQTIQLAVAPVFLLAGIGAFLNLCAVRLGRIIDRARVVEKLVPQSAGDERDRLITEIRLLDRRIGVVNFAILLSVISALLVCAVVILLFADELAYARLDTLIALLFIGAMVAIGVGFATFIHETRLASRVVRIRNELLELDDTPPAKG